MNEFFSDFKGIKSPPSTELEEVLNKLIPCIQPDCDLHGTFATADSNGDPEPNQCQYCYEVRFPKIEKAKSKIQELITKHTLESKEQLLDLLIGWCLLGVPQFNEEGLKQLKKALSQEGK